jgi:hypothetical protein
MTNEQPNRAGTVAVAYLCWCDGSACNGYANEPFGVCAECKRFGHRPLPSGDLDPTDVIHPDFEETTMTDVQATTVIPMRWRKKPVEVWAMRFTTNNENGSPTMDAIVNWVNQGKGPDNPHAWHNGTDIYIETLEGTMSAQVGDFIIRGVQGEYYPCKPDIFAATYEVVG